MDKDELNTILTDARVPEGLRDLVLAKGFDCPSHFAFAFPAIADLQPFIASASAFWTANQIDDPESSVAAARLRKALAECHRLCASAQPAGEPSSASTAPAMQQNQFSSWAEHLPPKLTTERVTSAFKANYPGELLDADTAPSIRLLSLVHEGLKPGQTLKWVSRLSARQYQERMEAKSAKAVRSELQLLSHAFFDDTPEINVENYALSPGWLMRIQTVFRNALALCQAAHLSNLKAFDKKMADLCLTQPDSNLGLRTVTMPELLSADRKLWSALSDLLTQQWSLDDALYELTYMRNDMHALLQLRPKIAKAPIAPPPRPSAPRDRGTKRERRHSSEPAQPSRPSRPGKKGKGKSKGASRASQTPKPKANWCTSFKGREICKRYQTGLCTSDSCQFAHVCAIMNCQLKHAAMDPGPVPHSCLRRHSLALRALRCQSRLSTAGLRLQHSSALSGTPGKASAGCLRRLIAPGHNSSRAPGL